MLWDNDSLAARVAHEMQAQLVIFLNDCDGVTVEESEVASIATYIDVPYNSTGTGTGIQVHEYRYRY